jgi:hypothetical protein
VIIMSSTASRGRVQSILSIGLSINSSLLGAAGAFALKPGKVECQVVLLLLGELRTTDHMANRLRV